MGARSLSNDPRRIFPTRRIAANLSTSKKRFLKSHRSPADTAFDGMSNDKDFPVTTLKVPGSPTRPLTSELADVLLQVADQLARGRAVFVAPYDTALTTQDAADFLGISRPTLVKLLENGAIPFKRIGRHRRVLLADLQQYMSNRHRENMNMFDDPCRRRGSSSNPR